MKFTKAIILMILLFLTACAAQKGSYYLYDIDSFKGEPGLISTSRQLKITVVDNFRATALIKKYNKDKERSRSRLNDYYLPPGKHTITAAGNSGYGMTIFGSFTFKVQIESGHHYMVSCEDKERSHVSVYIEDLTTGKKVGALQ